MKKLIVIAVLAVAAAAPAQTHHPKRHYHHAAARSYPDSVTLEGKEYKVCKPGMQDDCVQAHQAELGHAATPTRTAPAHRSKRRR